MLSLFNHFFTWKTTLRKILRGIGFRLIQQSFDDIKIHPSIIIDNQERAFPFDAMRFDVWREREKERETRCWDKLSHPTRLISVICSKMYGCNLFESAARESSQILASWMYIQFIFSWLSRTFFSLYKFDLKSIVADKQSTLASNFFLWIFKLTWANK